MNIKALALATFAVIAPNTALGQTVTEAEVNRAAATLCAGTADMTDCIQHLSDDKYAQLAKNVVSNRCRGMAVEAARLAVRGDRKAAMNKHYDASDCAIGVMMGTQDPVLQDEAQAYSIAQRATAARLQSGLKAAVRF